MIDQTELDATLEDHEVAFTEVSFLLEVLCTTISDVIGNSAPSLAISAGRQRARKLPVHLLNPDLQRVMELLRLQLQAGFDLQPQVNEKGARVNVGRCAIRDVCHNRNLEVGGELCQMLHNYWAGMAAQLLGRPVRARDCQTGDSCSLELQSR